MTGYWSTLAVLVIAVIAVTAVAVILLLVAMVRAYPKLARSRYPVLARSAWWAAVLYALSPWDLAAEPVLLDDIGVLLVVWLCVGRVGRAASARQPAQGRSRR